MDSSTTDSFSVISLRDVMNIIFRYKYLVVILFVVCSSLSYVYVRMKQDIYLSDAKLLLTVGRENIQMLPTGDNAVSVSRSQVQDINAEIEILYSPELYAQLFDDLDMASYVYKQQLVMPETPITSTEFAEARAQIIDTIMQNINIQVIRNSNVIDISYGSPDPEFAYNVVSHLIEIYMDKRTDIHYSTGSFNFFNDQSNKYLTALNEIEKKLSEIKNDLNVTSIEEYRTSLMTRIQTLRSELDLNNAALAESESQIEMIRSEFSESPTISGDNTLNYDAALQELLDLQVQERDLSSRYTADNIQVKNVRSRINDIRSQLQNTSQDDGVSPATLLQQQDLIARQIELTGLKARNTELQKLMTQTGDDLRKLNEAELTINQLERDREIQYDNYMKYSENLEEARIDQIVQQDKLSNIKILQSATKPLTPVANRKYRDLALGMFLGLFGGLGLAFALDYMDHTIKTPEDIEKHLRLQTLTSIPFNSNRKDIDAVTHLLLENGNKVG